MRHTRGGKRAGVRTAKGELHDAGETRHRRVGVARAQLAVKVGPKALDAGVVDQRASVEICHVQTRTRAVRAGAAATKGQERERGPHVTI
jgi:hypothetical protein